MDEAGTWHGDRPQPRRLCVGWGPNPLPQFSAHFYSGQTAACIKMPLGVELGLGPGDFVLDGDPAPLPKKGRSFPPQLLARFYCGQTAGCIKMPLGMDVGLSPRGLCVRWRPSPTSPKRERSPQIFGPCLLFLAVLVLSRASGTTRCTRGVWTWTVVATKALRMVDRCQAAADHDAAVQAWSPEPDNTSRCRSEVRGCCRRQRWTPSSRAEVQSFVKLLLPYRAASRLVWQYATLSCCDAALLFCSYFNCSRCIYLLVGPSSELVINFDSGHCLIAVTVIAAVCK